MIKISNYSRVFLKRPIMRNKMKKLLFKVIEFYPELFFKLKEICFFLNKKFNKKTPPIALYLDNQAYMYINHKNVIIKQTITTTEFIECLKQK